MLLVIRPYRPTLAEVPFADLSFFRPAIVDYLDGWAGGQIVAEEREAGTLRVWVPLASRVGGSEVAASLEKECPHVARGCLRPWWGAVQQGRMRPPKGRCVMRFGVVAFLALSSVAMAQQLTMRAQNFRTLSAEDAESLGRETGGLNLNQLIELTPQAAEGIARHRGMISLYILPRISDEAAEALASHEGDLCLYGLRSLSDNACDSLAKHKGGYLDLGQVRTLSDKGAKAFADHDGQLNLDGISMLPDEAIKSLAQHKEHKLNLSGLPALSDAAADFLSGHDGELALDGVKALSDKGAEALAKHKMELSLMGLATVPNKGLAALRANPKIQLPSALKK